MQCVKYRHKDVYPTHRITLRKAFYINYTTLSFTLSYFKREEEDINF